jgi:DNA-binding transcriptional ArsR family regulator
MAAPAEDRAPALAALEARAAAAARLLHLLGNERRLLLLCHLEAEGEIGVTALAERVGLSQPALSQHLALLRAEGLVAPRRQAQTVFYRLADAKAAHVLSLLRDLYCPAPAAEEPAR